MQDAFASLGGLRNRRFFGKREAWGIPASLGVRQGFMADVERPLPEGVTPQRKARRIPTTLKVLLADTWHRLAGDVSAGGALLLFPTPILEGALPLVIQLQDGGGTWSVEAEILRIERRGRQYAHHLRFAETADVEGLEAAIESALAQGHTRLETV
jgi:hypothetical protein